LLFKRENYMSLQELEVRVRNAKPIFLTWPDIKLIRVAIMKQLALVNTSNVEELKTFISGFTNKVIRFRVIKDILKLAYKDPISIKNCADLAQRVSGSCFVWSPTCLLSQETPTSLDVRTAVIKYYLSPVPGFERSIDTALGKQNGFLVEIELLTLLFAKLLLKFRLQVLTSTPGLDAEIDALIALTGKFKAGSYLRNALCGDYSCLTTVLALLMFATGGSFLYASASSVGGICTYALGAVFVLPPMALRCAALRHSYRYGVSQLGTGLKNNTAAEVWDEAEKIANDYIAPTYTPGNASGRPPSPPVYDENSPLITAQPQ
jgi:hypothetical protein